MDDPKLNGVDQPPPDEAAKTMIMLSIRMKKAMEELSVAAQSCVSVCPQFASNAQLYFDQIVNETGHAAFAMLVREKLGITTAEFLAKHVDMLEQALMIERVKAQNGRRIAMPDGRPPRRQ